MTKDRKLYALYLYFALYFVSLGMSTFAPKFYGEIGLSDGAIGLMSAVMALVALFMQPAWGILADRARYKRTVLAVALALSGGMCFLTAPAAGRFWPLLVAVTLYNTFLLPAMPVGTAISIEYTSGHGHSHGPVRMMGTVGYQLGILATGFIFTGSLVGLYPAMGAVLLLAAGAALLLPGVRGHQHAYEKVSPAALLKDRTVLLLLAVTFFAHIGHQFNLAFFTKHLGDLGIDNRVTGFISTLSVMLEIPFLLFGDRLMKRMSVWRWMLLGLLLGGARFALLSVVRAPVLILLAQSLSIFHLACFEFFPMVYLGQTVRRELQASSQSALQTISFGGARIVGSLAGGLAADAMGIPTVYAMCAGLMLATAAVFWATLRSRTDLGQI